MMRSRFPMVEKIELRVDLQEKRALQEAARKSGLTVSEFIRIATTRAISAVAA